MRFDEFEERAREEFLEAAEERVYHFTSLATVGAMAGYDGVPRLRMSPFRNMNDPWEADTRFMSALAVPSAVGVVDEIEAEDRPVELAEKRSRWHTHHLRARRFAKMRKAAPAQLEHLASSRLGFRAICFGQDAGADPGWAQDAMWAHYADRSAGVCLVFEKQPLVDAARCEFERYRDAVRRPDGGWLNEWSPRLVATEVAYAPMPDLGKLRARDLAVLLGLEIRAGYDKANLDYLNSSDDLPESLVQAVERWRAAHESRCAAVVAGLCGTKSSAWTYENEFRLIAYSLSRTGVQSVDRQIMLPIGDALVGVIVGPYAITQPVRYFLQLMLEHAGLDTVWRYEGNGLLRQHGWLEDGRLKLRPDRGEQDIWRLPVPRG